MAKIWTYDTLAQADRKTLENVLLEGTAPDMEKLNGYIYCGWNHEWIGRLSGEKFKKGFWKKEGKVLGFNEMCHQDRKRYQGEWKVRTRKNGVPYQLAFFRTGLIKDEKPIRLYRPYQHLGHFNYNIKENNSLINFTMKVIRDMVVLPNEGDHDLMLCKAYFRLLPFLNIFYCYFLLGHKQEMKYFPWEPPTDK
ncbi:MAG: hypothetical protein GY940_25330 [bacterium]|nr:hypothetical protein [bacterium]